jgi:hypothetical protein
VLRALLRLCAPRELADRSDAPLEYPENASDRPLLALRCDVCALLPLSL